MRQLELQQQQGPERHVHVVKAEGPDWTVSVTTEAAVRACS